MSMMTLKCPKCAAEAKLSLADNDYTGPRRCWKCHEFFTITIVNNKVISCEPLSKEEYERQQEAKKAQEKNGGRYRFLKTGTTGIPQDSQIGKDSGEETTDIFKQLAGKSKGGIDFSKREEPKTQPKPEFIRAPMPQPPSGQAQSQNRRQCSPGKPRDLTKPASPPKPSIPTEPGKPFKYAPIRTFVPIEDIKEDTPEKPKKPKKGNPPPEGWNSIIPPQK